MVKISVGKISNRSVPGVDQKVLTNNDSSKTLGKKFFFLEFLMNNK
jgi:hypothetical protein